MRCSGYCGCGGDDRVDGWPRFCRAVCRISEGRRVGIPRRPIRGAQCRAWECGGEFVGTFRSLWLFEVATGRSRKLCDYVGVAAVGWSGADFVVVTQYLSKRTSRALVFPMPGPGEPVLLDQPTLIRMVPPELRETLRKNDHVFVEGSKVEGETLYLRVWGYGQHDANGFRWGCEYSLREGAIACKEEHGLR